MSGDEQPYTEPLAETVALAAILHGHNSYALGVLEGLTLAELRFGLDGLDRLMRLYDEEIGRRTKV